MRNLLCFAIVFIALFVTSCKRNKNVTQPKIVFENKSVTPALAYTLPGFEKVELFALITGEDVLPGSPSFVFGPQPDGAGLIKDPASSGFILLNNHEIIQSVSRVYLDEKFTPTKGEYIVDAKGGQWRLCSASMATPKEHGYGPIFLTAGESGSESMVHGIDPFGIAGDAARTDRVLPALGKASMENALPLPKDAYAGKTIVFTGEDQSFQTSHVSAGQLGMYLSNTVGDLKNGKFHVLKATDGNQVEMNMTMGNKYNVEFVEIPNAKDLTGALINTTANSLGCIRFSRVEDLDYRKGGGANSREVYFTATGQSPDQTTPEPGYTMWGRIYRLIMDASNPLKGTLELVAEGDSDPGNSIINPDNLCVTENYVYIQEDGDSYYLKAKHDSYIWQYNISSKVMKPFIAPKHDRTSATWNTRFNQTNETRFGSWEWGAMYDVSDQVGVPNTFLLNIHPHTWTSDKFQNADGSGLTTNKQGAQTILLRNVPR